MRSMRRRRRGAALPGVSRILGKAVANAWASLWAGAGLRRRYDGLALREQRLVVAVLALAGLALAYAVAAPVAAYRQAGVQRHVAEQADLRWMRDNQERAGQPTRNSDRAAGPQGRLSTINAAAKDVDLSLRRLQPDANGFTVQIEAQPFAKVIRWSNALETRHGIEIASVSINVEAPGIVNARFNVR